MPIYEYACHRCGAEQAHLVRMGDPATPRCEACGSRRLRRLVSRVNVVGARAADPSALRSTSRDFLERPERFGEAMRALESSTGMKLSGDKVDGAIARLESAKKSR
ncbi:MAG: zinc ribbon domain-containing protein [Candidatus Binatia bacterium]